MSNNTILVVGGANIEYILKSKEQIVLGGKNFVDIEELFGGSGMNYASRLLAVGADVIPLLFIGDDSIGHKIYELLKSYEKNLDLSFVSGLTTPRSIIIVDEKERTILSQDQNSSNIFRSFIEERISSLEDPSSLIIGHIHNDRKEINQDRADLTTTYLLDRYRSSDTLVYLNFGATQLEYGCGYWQDHLKDADLFQLNIHELANFIDGGNALSLYELLSKLRSFGTSAIITLDKFGAIGIHKDNQDTIYLARALNDEENFIDSTGAGDAYCAGMVYRLNGKKDFNHSDLKDAMLTGRAWATFACNSYGGANMSPSKDEIELYCKRFENSEVATYRGEAMKDILSLLENMIKSQ